MSRTGNFSKVQSAGDLAELTAGTCSSDDSESSRRVAEVVMGHDGFVHNPGEQVCCWHHVVLAQQDIQRTPVILPEQVGCLGQHTVCSLLARHITQD